MTSLRSHHRTSLALGWEAARANLAPALLIQALMLALLSGYYLSPPVAGLLNELAAYKSRHGFAFVVPAAVVAGALLPELFLIFFFQGGRPGRLNLRNLLFTIPVWAIDGLLVDVLYRSEAAWLGDVVTLPVVLGKICIDQFGYNPFFAAPFGVLAYEWKNTGFSLESLVRAFTWDHYRDQDRADVACHLVGLDSAHGDHLFPSAGLAISSLQPGPYFLGPSPDLYD